MALRAFQGLLRLFMVLQIFIQRDSGPCQTAALTTVAHLVHTPRPRPKGNTQKRIRMLYTCGAWLVRVHSGVCLATQANVHSGVLDAIHRNCSQEIGSRLAPHATHADGFQNVREYC